MDWNKNSREWKDWRWQIAHQCSSPSQLQEWMGISEPLNQLERVLERFRMGITPYYFSLIETYEGNDPIYRQIIPSPSELMEDPLEVEDPIGDEDPQRGSRPLKALVHRYPDRVLLFPTALCAVYCRFCFRKRLVGETAHNAREDDLQEAISYIQGHTEISEVILTGGDPLTLSDERLMKLLVQLDTIPHVRVIRLHTRFPVVNPFRLSDKLGSLIGAVATPIWVSAHFNHRRELTPTAIEHIQGWIRKGIPFLNQSVLLRGVNDSAEELQALFRGLIEARIKPYYLHQADLVKGTSHLRTTAETGLKLLRELQGTLPGYAIPHFVQDDPTGSGKLPLQNQYDLYHP